MQFSRFFALAWLSFFSATVYAQDTVQEYEQQVQEMYVAYYGRPGDPGGVNYWAGALEANGGDLTAIIDAFGFSDEYFDRFGDLDDEALVNNIYQQLFGRDADETGLAFYVGRLQSGAMTLATIALNIADGVNEGTDDFDIVSNKLEHAAHFTATVALLGADYGADSIDEAFAMTASVDGSSESLQAAIDATLSTVAGFGLSGGRSNADYFEEQVSEPVVQDTCIACHVEGGVSGHTRLVFVDSGTEGHAELNYEQFANLAAEEEDAADYVLSKVQGVGHGGGVQLTADSEEFAALAGLMALITGDSVGTGGGDVFDGLSKSSNARTLRRASLLLGGELPEQSLDVEVSEAELRSEVRALMQGDAFHKFLIEGANDRLLTDKWIDNAIPNFFFQPYYPNLVNLIASYYDAGDQASLRQMGAGVGFGLARQPLELIAYIVENDLPYTDILTAEYTMVNPQLDIMFGSGIGFEDESNFDQWQVGTVEDYVRIDESTVYERAEIGAYVSGGLPTDYPQAGLLNTPGWLARYPSTDTNRNRARSRWTYYHFVGLDIEKSASRTTDPDALADTDNPTLNNPNCTVCHETMDPVSGAYQNYGDDGFYKDQFLGMDSLPRLYKRDSSVDEPYQFGEVWYNDMLEPGFNGEVFSDTDQTLRLLADAIVADDRFAEATVKFWWPALMGEDVATAPEETSDANYENDLLLFQQQSAAILELADGFRNGFDGGSAYDLKDLLTEMVLSDWFRYDSAETLFEGDQQHLLSVGSGKLLTPEQLDRKTLAVTGYRWYESSRNGISDSQLTDEYRMLYGGIDSDAVTARATEVNSLMSTVVEAQPLQMGCVLVALEFQLPAASRLIFTEVSKDEHEANAEAAIRSQLQAMHERMLGEVLASDDVEIDRALALFTETRQARIDGDFPTRLHAPPQETCPLQFVAGSDDWDLDDPDHVLNSWVSMMNYFMTDYRYIYE